MRAGGARVGVDELLAAHRALGAVDASQRTSAYFALRAALCSRREDLPVFDAAFEAGFAKPVPVQEPPEPLAEVASIVLPRTGIPRRDAVIDVEAEVVPAAWSDVELLREKDFAAYTEDERRLAR